MYMPPVDVPVQIAIIIPNLILFVIMTYYLWRILTKEQELQKKEEKIDSGYHQVVDNALSKERKILEDAVAEADEIIAGAQYISQESKDVVKEALEKMAVDIQKATLDTAQQYRTNHDLSLKQLTMQSITDFQDITKSLKENLQKELESFHSKLLPKMEGELEEYKRARLEQIDKVVVQIVQIASQEILNKTLSVEDHEHLVRESLEKAKKEGAFD